MANKTTTAVTIDDEQVKEEAATGAMREVVAAETEETSAGGIGLGEDCLIANLQIHLL